MTTTTSRTTTSTTSATSATRFRLRPGRVRVVRPVRMVGLRPVALVGPGRAQRVIDETRAEIPRATLQMLGLAVLLGVLVAAALGTIDGVGLLYRALHAHLDLDVTRDLIRAGLWVAVGAAAVRLDDATRGLARTVREAGEVRRCPTCRSAAAALISADERWSDCTGARHTGRAGHAGAR